MSRLRAETHHHAAAASTLDVTGEIGYAGGMVAIVLLTVLAASGDGLVPEPHPVRFEAKRVKKLPRATDIPRLSEALDLIRSLESSSLLDRPDDRAIFRFLRDIKEEKRTLTFVFSEGFPDNSRGIMGYECGADELYVTPVETGIPSLAIFLYHELTHIVRCDALIVRLKLADRHETRAHFMAQENECPDEEPAYAAQVRMTLALRGAGKLPRKVSVARKGDARLLPTTVEVWHAIHAGRFCDWYRGKGFATKGLK